MNDLHALLTKVCDPGRRPLATPFGVNIGRSPGARWDVASNGRLLLALADGRLDLREPEPISTAAARLLSDAPEPTYACAMSALREWAGADYGIRSQAEQAILDGWVGGFAFDRNLLASVVHGLPGDRVHVGVRGGGDINYLALYGPGWRLLVAGLIYGVGGAPRLALTPIEEAAA